MTIGALEEIELLLFRMIICGISSISAPSYEEMTASELALLPCTTIKRGEGWHRTTGRTSLRRSERKPTAAAAPQAPPGPGHLPPEGSTAAACPESSVRPHCGGRKQGTVAEAPATGCRKRTREAWVGSLRVPDAYSRLAGRLHGALHVLSWDQGPNR